MENIIKTNFIRIQILPIDDKHISHIIKRHAAIPNTIDIFCESKFQLYWLWHEANLWAQSKPTEYTFGSQTVAELVSNFVELNAFSRAADIIMLP